MKKRQIIIILSATILCLAGFSLWWANGKKTNITSNSSQNLSNVETNKKNKKTVVVGKVFKNGYLKKHGNHYHYVKGAPPADAIYENINENETADDNYTFDEKDIVERNEWGYVVKHGDHYHFIHKKTKNISQNQIHHPIPNENSSSHKSNSALENRIKELMQKYGLQREQIIVNKQNQTLVYPHGNHYHYEKIGESNSSHNDEIHHEKQTPNPNKTEKNDSKTDNTTNLDNRIESIITNLMKKYGLKRTQITVDKANNAIIYPHGNHYHYEKIDPTKPITNHNQHGIQEEKDDQLYDSETHKIVGPLAVSREQLLNKKEIMKASPNLPIKDIAHYHIVGFLAYPNSREKVGDLLLNNQSTDGVIYLVLKNTPWKEVKQTIKHPLTKPKDGYYFKSWTSEITDEGIVDYSRIFGAQFRLEKYKNSPLVLGPSTTKEINGSENIDLHDYVPVSFHTVSNGQFMINGQLSKHAFYLIKQGTTWKEAFANGFTLPKTVADPLFEFSGFSEDIWKNQDQKVSSEFIWTKFSSTLSIIGAYKPTDINNPLALNDPRRPHPKDSLLPYDAANYVTLAFVAKDNGQLDTFFEQTKVLTYIVRKGITWSEIQSELPKIIADEGYQLRADSKLPNSNEQILNDNIYYLYFEKKT